MTTLPIRQGDASDGWFPVRLTVKRSGQPNQEAEAKIQFTLTESEQADLPWHLEHQTPDFPLCRALANPEGCQPGAGG